MTALDFTRPELDALRAAAEAQGLTPLVADCTLAAAGAAPVAVLVRLQCAIDAKRRATQAEAQRQATYEEAMARS